MDAIQNKSNLNPFSTFLIIGTAWAFDALDVGLLSFVMPLIRKEWLLTQSQTGLVSSVSSIGMIAGGFLFGHLADKVGRQKTLIASLLLFSLGNVVLAFTQGFVPFLIVRFIVGAGLGGELPVAATYIAELYSGKKRSMMLILADSFWAVGWLVAAFLSYALSGLLGWRGLLIVTACSGFFVVAIRKHVSDSDDVKQNTKEKFDFNALKQAFTWRTPLLWTAWFMVMFSYYGMFMWLPSILVSKGNSFVSSFGYTTLMVVAQLPGYFGAAWLTKHVRLRYIFSIYMLGTALGAVMFGNAVSVSATIIAGCVLSFFNLGAYGAIIALTPSLYHVKTRGTMTGLAEGMGRFGAVVGPLLVGFLMDKDVSINSIFILFMVSLIVGAIAVLALPDENLSKDGQNHAE